MDRLLTPQELAENVGLAVQTIYNRHSTGGSLPACIRIGRLLRFRQSDVDIWLTGLYENSGSKEAPSSDRYDLSPRPRGRPRKSEQVLRRQHHGHLATLG